MAENRWESASRAASGLDLAIQTERLSSNLYATYPGDCEMIQVYSFRCYAYQDGDLFLADCLDLMLMSQGATMQEAIRDLREMILGYLEWAEQQGQIKPFIPRPAPLRDWLKFYGLYVSSLLKALLLRRFSNFRVYTERVAGPVLTPAQPAPA